MSWLKRLLEQLRSVEKPVDYWVIQTDRVNEQDGAIWLVPADQLDQAVQLIIKHTRLGVTLQICNQGSYLFTARQDIEIPWPDGKRIPRQRWGYRIESVDGTMVLTTNTHDLLGVISEYAKRGPVEVLYTGGDGADWTHLFVATRTGGVTA